MGADHIMSMKTVRRRGLLALALLGLLSCGGRQPDRAEKFVREAPSWQQLKTATYYGLQLPGAPITLTDGSWQRVRTRVDLAPDFRIVGDVSNDGNPDAVVILAESGGGSGTFNYLAVVGYRNDRLENLGTVPLGDRVQVKGVVIRPGELEAEVVQAGPGDPACCPGDFVKRVWRYDDAGLQEVTHDKPQRFNLAALEGTQWVLRSMDLESTVPAEPQVTLTIMETALSGSTGCNNYSTPAKSGEMGKLTIGMTAASKMACLPEASSVERQFLEALGKVDRISFLNGRLLLHYPGGETPSALSFDPLQP
jgi:heat shock protein HslJ